MRAAAFAPLVLSGNRNNRTMCSLTRLLSFRCLAVILALVVGSKMARAETDLSELDGTFWHLGRTGGVKDVIVRIASDAIDFSTFCQSALYRIRHDDSGSLKLASGGPAVTRRRPCFYFGTQSRFTSAIEERLSRIRHYAMSDDELTFLDDRSHSVMALTRIVATGFEYREWSIAGYSDGQKLVVAERNAELAFVRGRVGGTPGCGMLSGEYRLSGARLKVRTGWLIRGYCSGDYEPQNNAVVKALSGKRFIEHDNGRIILRDALGAAQIVLKP